jgi:DNA-binding transcriptional MerR regulator
MRLIKRLKSLGLDLHRIKEVIGDLHNTRTMQETLQALKTELLNEKKTLEDRVDKIEALLDEDIELLNEDVFASPSFQMITEILGAEQIEKYAQACPEIYEQHRKINSILDDFQWNVDYQKPFRTLAEYFKAHPEDYKLALLYGARYAQLAHAAEDDPQIKTLAFDSAALIKSMPQVRDLLLSHLGKKNPMNTLYQNMVAGVLSPAQIKYQELVDKFLLAEE